MKTFLNQNWFKISLVLLILIFGSYFAGILGYNKTKTITTIENLSDEEMIDFFKGECGQLVEEQREKAKLILNNNELALKILSDECLWAMSDQTRINDFDGDGENEIAMITSGAGCGSCHGQEIRIIKDNKIIFYKDGIDFVIKPAEEFTGFILEQPGDNGVPICCTSGRIIEAYELNKDSKSSETFVKIWEKNFVD